MVELIFFKATALMTFASYSQLQNETPCASGFSLYGTVLAVLQSFHRFLTFFKSLACSDIFFLTKLKKMSGVYLSLDFKGCQVYTDWEVQHTYITAGRDGVECS